jgi:TetR/AcrR family tetracycline transcriptional repressor
VAKKQAGFPAVPVRERLTRETIVDSALALADAEGLEAVTIRRLALDQGVTPMALYWHFRDKDLLLNGVVERLLSEVVLPDVVLDDATPWDLRIRELLGAMLVVLRSHPNVADLVPVRMMLSTPGLDLTERALGVLRGAGFSPEQSAQLAGHGLSSIVLLVMTEPGRQVGTDAEVLEQQLRTKRAALQALSPDRYPNVLASAEGFIACGSASAYFDLGLDLFIEGIRSLAPAK